MNAVTYKELFPLIRDNELWLGNGFQNGNAYFRVEAPREQYADGVYNEQTGLVKFRNCCWFTNIEHGRRHEPLRLMTMADNFKHSKHKEIRGKSAYEHYDNYDAIEIPYTDAIPSDYDGVMGVPISFFDKYCPEQFEIVGMAKRGAGDPKLKSRVYTKDDYANYSDLNATPTLWGEDGNLYNTYPRVLIRKKK
jgi:hypothetical protein